VTAIAETTVANITFFDRTGRPVHELSHQKVARGQA
jgi:hypothetical protein